MRAETGPSASSHVGAVARAYMSQPSAAVALQRLAASLAADSCQGKNQEKTPRESWDQNFYQPTLGDQAFLTQMHERGRRNNGGQLDYTFGLVLTSYRGLPVVEHGGSDAGYRAHLIRFPEQHFSVVCLCQMSASVGQ